MSIFAHGITRRFTEEEIKELFSEYGVVKGVRLPIDKETGRRKNFCFVDMETEADELLAIEALNGYEWMGMILTLSKVQPKPKNIVLNIDVSKSAQIDAVALEISNLCRAINAYHIACNGTGLVIDDWEILIQARQLVGV